MSTQSRIKSSDGTSRTLRRPTVGEHFARDKVSIHFDRAEHLYGEWRSPICIVSDGPYGIGGFPGDPPTVDALVDFYGPHVEQWSVVSTPETTLWFWATELGLKQAKAEAFCGPC